jgi:hypothetical protein
MNQFIANLASCKRNGHVSIPVALCIACEIGAIWLPHYASQFRLTSKVLVGYAALAAANTTPETKPAMPDESKDSTAIKKEETK